MTTTKTTTTTEKPKESGPPRRAALLFVSALGTAALAAVAAILLLRDGGSAEGPRTAALGRCVGLEPSRARACYTRELTAMVGGADDPRPAVAAAAATAWREGGFLLANCHGVMHTVGRTYAREAGVALATLMDYLPRSNDPGCSAGFAHGLVTAVAPEVDPRRPADAARVCGAAPTRYRRYSCVHGFGHAFMRIYGGGLAPALELCRGLGARAAPDCAQGVYHDYWFAVVGADDARLPGEATTDPRQLCGSQPRAFVRPCWYRAFVDNRPVGVAVRSPRDLDALCAGLAGLQREACMTAAAVIGPPDPAVQLEICAGVPDPVDAENCVRGTKVQNLLGRSTAVYVDLIRRCDLLAGTTGASCYRWLGKTLSVLTDGAFAEAGCGQLRDRPRRHCRAGARSIDEALVTFS